MPSIKIYEFLEVPLSVEDNILETISIYPNPIEDILFIENNNSIEITSMKIYDMLGRLVLEKKENIIQLNISRLESGLFFIVLKTEAGIITKKLIKK